MPLPCFFHLFHDLNPVRRQPGGSNDGQDRAGRGKRGCHVVQHGVLVSADGVPGFPRRL